MKAVPDYASSLMAAEKNLKECFTNIIDEQDLVAALTSAFTAQLAVSLLIIDLEMKLRDQKPEPVKKKEEKAA